MHEEAIDGAVVQATAVRRALLCDDNLLDPVQFIEELIEVVRTDAMRQRLENVKQEYLLLLSNNKAKGAADINKEEATPLHSLDEDYDIDKLVLERLVPNGVRPGSGLGFQIASIDAIPCVIWFVMRYANTKPEQILPRVIALGGDTDTIASMAGAIVGALHGLQGSGGSSEENGDSGSGGWIATHLIDELENGERGRDYAMQLAERLCELDLVA